VATAPAPNPARAPRGRLELRLGVRAGAYGIGRSALIATCKANSTDRRNTSMMEVRVDGDDAGAAVGGSDTSTRPAPDEGCDAAETTGPPESRFETLVAGAGVSRIRFHDLRHTHASLLLARGVPVKVVSERLGHANPAFTMTTSTYCPACNLRRLPRLRHLWTGDDRQGPDGVGGLLAEAALTTEQVAEPMQLHRL
jgi:hypothetical protein